MQMKAIDTVYKGHRFRSRLEARWAVFFNSLGLSYEYEKEGFDLDGILYLPDFWMPALDIFIEIKGSALTKLDERKIEALVRASNKNCLVLIGQIGPPDTEHNVPYDCPMYSWYSVEPTDEDPETGACNYDSPYIWCECVICGKIGAEFDARSGRLCRHPNVSEKNYNANSPRLMAAYRAAMGARFEHGESGAERN